MSTVYPADIRGLVTTLLLSLRAPASVYKRGSSPLSVVEGCAQPGPDLFPKPKPIDYLITILSGYFHLLRYGPHESNDLSGHSGRCQVWVLTSGDKPAIALAEPHLCSPGNVADLLR